MPATAYARLVLTHVPPWYRVADMVAEAAASYDGELLAAQPGAVFDV